MPSPKLNSLKSVRTTATLTAEQVARLANLTVKAVLAEEDAVAKGLPGGSQLDPAEQGRLASALATTVATLKA